MNSQPSDSTHGRRPAIRRFAAYLCAACVVIVIAWRWIWPFTGLMTDVLFLAVAVVGLISGVVAGVFKGNQPGG
jgi:hypothetical protein